MSAHTDRFQQRPAEGVRRFCRACGHDLPGLSATRCPNCGRTSPIGQKRTGGGNGKWLVIGLMVGGLTLAVLGVRYRVFEPKRSVSGSQPTTSPTSSPSMSFPSSQPSSAPASMYPASSPSR